MGPSPVGNCVRNPTKWLDAAVPYSEVAPQIASSINTRAPHSPPTCTTVGAPNHSRLAAFGGAFSSSICSMPPRKRTATADGDAREPVAKRRSSRQAASAAAAQAASSASSTPAQPPKKRASAINDKAKEDKTSAPEEKSTGAKSKVKQTKPAEQPDAAASSRAVSEDPDPDSIPKHNPEVERHSGQWYWLMKAEPESRFEDGVDVRFSIDDLRARTKPEGWDGEPTPTRHP